MIDIECIKQKNNPETIAITMHAKKRLTERRITVADIINGIETGEIIEQYENDTPLPSCLILGAAVGKKPIHIVLSNDEEYIYLITAYYPDEKLWEADLKTRKGR